MTFAFPLFLWLLPLAAAPILFHLLLKLRARRRVFSTLMFFDRIDPRLSARRRIRDWLILLLRMALIVLLLTALARPVWLALAAHGQTARIVIIDNSASMSASAADGRSKLAQAVEAALALLDASATGDAAGLALLVDDPLVTLPPQLTTDKALLKVTLDRLGETEAAGSVADALARARALSDAGPAVHSEFHIFTDLQENEWNRQPPAHGLVRPATRLYVHRLRSADETAANATIAALTLPPHHLPAGRRMALRVHVVNPSPHDAALRLQATDDQNGQYTQTLFVPGQGDQWANFLLAPAAAGPHWLTCRLEGDALAYDNRAALVFECAEPQPILCVGPSEAFGLLPEALAPAGSSALSGLTPVFIAAERLTDTLAAAPPPALIVLRWEDLPRVADDSPRLLSYLEAGGTLLVVPAVGDQTPAPPLAPWLEVTPDAAQATAEGAPVIVHDKNAPLFDALRNEKGAIALRHIKAFRYRPLRPPPGARSLLGLTDGRALLVERKVGAGTVFFSGVAFAPDHSTLPLKSGFLPLAQAMALAGNARAQTPPLAAGERFRAEAPPDTPATLQSLAGSALSWKGAVQALPAAARSGIYTLQAGAHQALVAVRAADSESPQRFLTGDTVPILEGLAYSVDTVDNIGRLLKQALLARKGLDLSPFLLAVALLAYLIEGWLVNRRVAARPENVPLEIMKS